MDHINDILKSDLLRRYALGEVSPKEKMKVDLLLIDHSEIRSALRNIEINIEQESIKEAITPPKRNREAIIKQLRSNQPNAGVISNPQQSSWKMWSGIAAAFIIGGFLSGLYFNSKNTAISKELLSVESEIIKLQTDCNRLADMYAFLNDGETKPYLLTGDAFQKDAQVVVYWNEQLEKSMLRVMNLPALDADKTYQLWADVDGDMLDLGIFDAGAAIVDPINMKYLANAESLNITVEPKGGSDHPTVSTLTANIAI